MRIATLKLSLPILIIFALTTTVLQAAPLLKFFHVQEGGYNKTVASYEPPPEGCERAQDRARVLAAAAGYSRFVAWMGPCKMKRLPGMGEYHHFFEVTGLFRQDLSVTKPPANDPVKPTEPEVCHPNYRTPLTIQGAAPYPKVCVPYPVWPKTDIDCAGGDGANPIFVGPVDYVPNGDDVYNLDGDGNWVLCNHPHQPGEP